MVPVDLVTFIKAIGYLGIFGAVFAESGLFIGFFLPGDSLLFTAGFLASQGYFQISILIALSFIGAILGDSFGYAFGRKTGPMLFKREDSLFFHKDHIVRAELFYERHGGKAIILARFIPVVRTFAPIIAGVGKMRYSTFLYYNVTGAVLWGVGVPLTGYFLGSVVPNIDKYIIPIIGLIIVVSVAPVVFHIFRDAQNREQLKKAVAALFKRKSSGD